MREFIVLATLSGMGVAACGGGSQDAQPPLESLVEDAAAGDAAAMTELEERARETAAELERTSSGDPELAFQTALYSGDADAVTKLSDAGNVWAQTHIATTISLKADMSEEEAAKARSLLEAAAEKGHGPALFRISEDYRSSGKLYPLDEQIAFQKGLEAAEAGHAESMFLTGVRYQYGQLNALVDETLARDWLEKAKAAGHPGAQRQLDEL